MEDTIFPGTLAGISLTANMLKNEISKNNLFSEAEHVCSQSVLYRSHYGRHFIVNQNNEEIQIDCVQSLEGLWFDSDGISIVPSF